MKYKKANVNIAILKYWGKADTTINLPYQTSVSITADNFYTLTNVELDPNAKKDVVILDDKALTGIQYTRVAHHLDALRKHFGRGEYCIVTSYNHVFIKAGYASSASAFAALAAAYVDAIGAKVSKRTVTTCATWFRFCYAFSSWWFCDLASRKNHKTSFAEKLPIDWPEFRMLFTIIDPGIKTVSAELECK